MVMESDGSSDVEIALEVGDPEVVSAQQYEEQYEADEED